MVSETAFLEGQVIIIAAMDLEHKKTTKAIKVARLFSNVLSIFPNSWGCFDLTFHPRVAGLLWQSSVHQ